MSGKLKHLDIENTKVQTKYCISEEQRDEQMLVANSRIKKRLVPSSEIHEDEIAIVCFGPSLQKTWRELKKFKYIMTCSGAHKFLIEKGIIPTWHVDLDPREHKVKMLGEPHKDVKYLMASTCHPKMWDVLEGFDVSLWHIFANEDNKNISVAYPRGDWILTGGNNVGQRCLVVARLLGYKNFHIFGMDCSFPKESGHHASAHLNPNPTAYETPYEGKTYYCEPVMIEYAKQFFHEMNQLPDVRAVLHGEGLLQHMAYHKRNDKITIKKEVKLAFSTPLVITPQHLEEMKKLHQNPVYGISGKKHKDVVQKLAESLNTRSIMDYGCGKATLGAKLPFPIWEYDPAIPGKEGVPRPADLVVALNVVEHVEPEMLDNVLGDLVRCSKVCVFAVIEAVKSKDWWNEKLNKYFKVATIQQAGNEIHCLLEPRKLGPLK